MQIDVKTKENNTTGYRPTSPRIQGIVSSHSTVAIGTTDSKSASEARALHAKKNVIQHSTDRHELTALPPNQQHRLDYASTFSRDNQHYYEGFDPMKCQHKLPT